MKKQLLFLFVIFGMSLSSHSQLPNGSIAPDFTLTDRDGNIHNLYNYLSQGKVVFLKFFACHCPSCWAYHNTGKLDSIYQTYGPDGTDQIMVLMLEHDQNNPDAFYGLGGYTQGDWITGNPIPMIDVEGASDRAVFDAYNLNYYPMVMKICTDKTTELMSTGYTVAELFQEADECPGNLGLKDDQIEGEVYLDQLNKQLKIQGFSEVTNITVFNMAGQEALRVDAYSDGTVDVSTLQKGMYVVQFAYSGGVYSQKILIQ